MCTSKVMVIPLQYRQVNEEKVEYRAGTKSKQTRSGWLVDRVQ